MPLRSYLSVLVLARKPYLRADHFAEGGSIGRRVNIPEFFSVLTEDGGRFQVDLNIFSPQPRAEDNMVLLKLKNWYMPGLISDA